MVLKAKHSSLEEFVNQGAPVVAETKEDKKEWTNFNVRLRKDLSAGIDKALEHRVGISKTGWIQEAIQEKLRKENE